MVCYAIEHLEQKVLKMSTKSALVSISKNFERFTVVVAASCGIVMAVLPANAALLVSSSNGIQVFDETSNQYLGNFSNDASGTLAVRDNSLFTYRGGSVREYNISTGEVVRDYALPSSSGNCDGGIAATTTKLSITCNNIGDPNFTTNGVVEFDLASGEFLKTRAFFSAPRSSTPSGIRVLDLATDPTGESLLASTSAFRSNGAGISGGRVSINLGGFTPLSIAASEDFIYFAQANFVGPNEVRAIGKVDLNTRAINSFFIPDGSYFNGPGRLELDDAGNLFFASRNGLISQFDADSGTYIGGFDVGSNVADIAFVPSTVATAVPERDGIVGLFVVGIAAAIARFKSQRNQS